MAQAAIPNHAYLPSQRAQQPLSSAKTPSGSELESRLRQLIAQLRAGDPGAADKIVALMQTPLLAKLYVKVPPHLVDDVYQETWARFYRQLDEQAQQPDSYVAWFLGIARLVTLEMLRDERRELPLPEDTEERYADHLPTPEQNAQGAQLRAALFHCLGKIPERYSRLLVGHVRGEAREALCEELDLALPNFGKLLYRARKAILKCLEPLTRSP